jgi:hypothetical protein
MKIDLKIKERFNKRFWNNLAASVKELIWTDASQGIFQNEKKDLNYKSESYKDYKSRYMQGKRLTRKVKPYNAVSVISNETKFVNMILTGRTRRNFKHEVQSDSLGINLFYDSQFSGLLLGNEENDRVIIGLRKKNQDYVFDEILSQVDEAIRKDFAKNITITL